MLADANLVTYSPAVDIYGLGATLYTMLVGHRPYRQNEDDVDHSAAAHHELRKRMRRGTFNQRSMRWESASPAFRHLVSWCLQRDPADRPTLSDILDSEWLQYGSNDPDVDIILPQQMVVDLSEDTMEQPTGGMFDDQQQLEFMHDKSAEDEGITLVSEPMDTTVATHESRRNAAAFSSVVAPTTDDEIVHERFDPAFEVQADFYGFDENAPPLPLPEEYYSELPLPEEDRQYIPPPPALIPVEPETTFRRPRTRQQRRTESQLVQPVSVATYEDSKASLRVLMQQLPPPGDNVVARIPKRTHRVVRTLPPTFGTTKREENFYGFSKTAISWRKTRASWRHFCLLINGVQQVLKVRFKKARRVYCLPHIKEEKLDHAYEKPLTFPRPKAQLKRTKREPKVPRPPTRVQPERARAMRQLYQFQ